MPEELEIMITKQDEADDNHTIGDLSASVRACFYSSKFSDLTIRTKDQEFKVHKLVICGQSEFFSRLFSANWKETTENVIQLQDDDPRAVEAMIGFMYGFDYNSSGSGHGRVSPMPFNVKMYQIGDKYGITKLKDRAKEKFEDIINTCWRMDDFPTTITEAYLSTPAKDRGLRDPLVRTSLEHINTLRENEDFVQVLQETLGFAVDLIQYSIGSRSEYRCPACNQQWQAENSGSIRYCPSCGSKQDWSAHIVKK